MSLSRQDVVKELVLRVVPILTQHLKKFAEAESTVRGKMLNRAFTEADELDLAIAKKFKGGDSMSTASMNMIGSDLGQQEFVGRLVLKVLPELPLDTESKSTWILTRELLGRTLFGPIIVSLIDPDTWNQLLEAYGKGVLQDRKSVKKLRAALNEHASPMLHSAIARPFPKLAPRDDERNYERFVRAVRFCNNVPDARRFRSEVASQLARELTLVDQDKAYLDRLKTAKQMLDHKVKNLSERIVDPPLKSSTSSQAGGIPGDLADLELIGILRDASGLSYFMEFMDRRNALAQVQFWIVVDGIRNPLEDPPEEVEPSESPSQWTASDRLDIAQIFEVYLQGSKLTVPCTTRKTVGAFLEAGSKASPEQYGQARAALLRAQKLILDHMQDKHLPNFRQSDLFFKYLASDGPYHKVIDKAHQQQAAQAVHTDLNAPRMRDKTFLRPLQSTFTKDPVVRSSPSVSIYHTSPYWQNNYFAHGEFDLPTEPGDLDKSSSPEITEPTGHGMEVDGDGRSADQGRIVAAMEAALSDIVTESNDLESREKVEEQQEERDLGENASEAQQQARTTAAARAPKPNIASLGLVSASSRIGVFMDDDLFGDEERFMEDEHADVEDRAKDKEVEDDIHEAAPGDLGLSEAIEALTNQIDRLVSQESVVDAMSRKAQLTNNHTELRILGKSMSSLQREIRRKQLQRRQFIVQESDSSLYGRAKISIQNVMVGRGEDGQEFAFYMIEVSRNAGEHIPAASWVVARRYREFHVLHQRLRRLYTEVQQLKLPRRRLVMKMQTEFLQRRRSLLENYLQRLLRLPAVCTSRALRSFLSQRPIVTDEDADPQEERADIISRLYSSVSEGMDEFLGNIPALDQLSIAGQNMAPSTTYMKDKDHATGLSEQTRPINICSSGETQAELDEFEEQMAEPFVNPVCELFVETFGLNGPVNWLRGQTLIIVLQQLLGGTIERKFREAARAVYSDESLLLYISLLKSFLWPAGVFQAPSSTRSGIERRKARTEASIVLATLLPELAGGVVGRANAQTAGRRIFAALNNDRLNAHLTSQVIDEFVAILLPLSLGEHQSRSQYSSI